MSISWDTDIADVEKFGTSLPNMGQCWHRYSWTGQSGLVL